MVGGLLFGDISVSRRTVLLVVLGVLLPNLAFLVSAEWLGIGRPYINVDYALAILLVAFGWRWLGLLSGLIFLFFDVLALAGQVLPFVRIADVFYLLQFATSASAFHFYLLVAVSFAVLFKLGVLVVLGGRMSRASALLVFNVLMAIYAVHANGSSTHGDKYYRFSGGALAASQTISFLKGRSSGFLQRFDYGGKALAPLAGKGVTADWFALKESGHERLLLIVAESWGVSRDKRIQDSLLRPLQDSLASPLEHGNLPFSGMTVGAELRELCRLQPNHFNLADAAEGFEGCLPNVLKAQGYSTAAMHGAMSLIYDRRHWYPRAGFEQSIFFESKLWPRRCYSFPGACDLDLRHEVEGFFSEPGKRFFYWLTLNTHSRYDSRDIQRDLFDCPSFAIPAESESCRNLKLQAQFFSGLGELMKAESMRGVEVIVVGDHEPVLMNLDEKKSIFVEGQVPWVRFKVE